MEPPNTVVPAESLPIDTFDTEGQQLRNDLAKADTGEGEQEPVATDPKPQDSAQTPEQRASGADTTEQTPDSPETSTERDEQGRFKAKAPAPTPEVTEQPQKQETEYAKAKKEQERQKSVLANFEAEKQRERAAIQAERQQLAIARQQLQQQAAQGQQPRFNSQHLWQAADEFEGQARRLLKDGEVDQANNQLDLATKARAEAQKAYYYEQQEAYQGQIATHRQRWESVTAKVINENPELADPNTEMAKQMQELLSQEPVFGQLEDGFKRALEVLQAKRTIAEVSGLKDENTKLKQQLKELQDRTAITGSGAQPHAEPQNFNEMSEAQQEDYLRRNASQYDRERYAA